MVYLARSKSTINMFSQNEDPCYHRSLLRFAKVPSQSQPSSAPCGFERNRFPNCTVLYVVLSRLLATKLYRKGELMPISLDINPVKNTAICYGYDWKRKQS
ncbi:hypothetical protein RB195_007949 [Necator americanus]|uniref:Uncharacterized protein n=1 Tax=Necator americanus TaxID=51031 RepID=A0ABR1BZQ0_NECAM